MSELVASWRDNNSKLGVTSFLLRLDAHFLQLIEGPPRTVSALMDRIWDDARHGDVQILLTGHDSNHHSEGHALSYADLVNGHGDGAALGEITGVCEGLCSASPLLHDWLSAHANGHPALQPRA